MRAELREKIGDALNISDTKQMSLDCLESNDVFLVFKPASHLGRSDFVDSRPLLRQAIVAACAAFETYLGDKAMASVGALVHSTETMTARLKRVALTLEDFVEIQERYERTGWGVRQLVVEPYVRDAAIPLQTRSENCSSAIGVENWVKRVDGDRNVASGESVRFLHEVTSHRNKIAHEGDRAGRGRGQLEVGELRTILLGLESIVHALERIIE